MALWLSFTPRHPHFAILAAGFPPLNSTNASATNNSIELVVDLQIFNPNNHVGIDYSGIILKLYMGDGVVGSNSAPAFYQGYKNTTLFHMQIQAMNATSYVDFTVRVETAFRFQIIKWQTKVHHVAHEKRFTKPDVNLNGTVSRGSYYVQLQNALKVATGN